MSEKFNNDADQRRKWFCLEGRGLELAEQLEQHILGQTNAPHELLQNLSDELELFNAAYVPVDLDIALPFCPALHRSQIEPENVYMFCPIDFDDASHVQPKSGVEITDSEELKKLDTLFAGGADMMFQHKSSYEPIYMEQAPDTSGEDFSL